MPARKSRQAPGGFGEGCDVVLFFVGWLCFYCVKHVNLDIFDGVNVECFFLKSANECCYLVILRERSQVDRDDVFSYHMRSCLEPQNPQNPRGSLSHRSDFCVR